MIIGLITCSRCGYIVPGGSCDHWTDYMLKMRLHSSRIAVLSLKMSPEISHVRSYLAIHKGD